MMSKEKRQPTEWGEYFANQVSNKGVNIQKSIKNS